MGFKAVKHLLELSATAKDKLKTRLELGRSTMEIDIKMYIIKYWQRVCIFSTEIISKHACMENIESSQSNKTVRPTIFLYKFFVASTLTLASLLRHIVVFNQFNY